MVLLGEYPVDSNNTSNRPRCVPADLFVIKQLEEAIDVICGAGVSPHQQSFGQPRPRRDCLTALLGGLGSGRDLRCPEDTKLIPEENGQA